MTTTEPRPVRALGAQRPRVHPSAWVAPTAIVVGDVEIGSDSSVWYSAVVRADMDTIRIGSRTNVQDGCALHSGPRLASARGRRRLDRAQRRAAGLHRRGRRPYRDGRDILNGAVIGKGSLVAAGATVLGGTEVPPGSLVAGLPAKVRRELDEQAIAANRANADTYVELARRHADELEQ